MICPYCGNENSDEHIYCESCGKEFQIVPDYDVEMEDDLNEAMNESVLVISEGDDHQTDEYNSEEYEDDFEEEFFLEEDPNLIETVVTRLKGKKIAVISIAAVAFVLLGVILFNVIHYYHVNSYDYQISHAKDAISNGNYGDAIKYLENALLYDDSKDEDKMLLANCFIKSENYDAATMILRELIASDPSNVEVYTKLVAIYEQNGEYDKINALLESCSDENVLLSFSNYVSSAPEFSLEEGVYNDVQILNLSENSNGIIYYTMDGSVPDKTSMVYTAPIVLDETGAYTISAVFINEFDVSSEVVSKNYIIDLVQPDATMVSLPSGIYDLPQMITIDVPKNCRVFYTIDGDVPNETSIQYMGPFYLQLGTHVYQYITYSMDDVPGEVTTCYYTLDMNTLYSSEKAVEMSKQFICNYGFTTDVYGHVEGKAGYNDYTCNTAFIYNETPFYLIVEKYVDTLGTATSTGNLYAFDANDTRFYHAYLQEDGTYIVEPIVYNGN